MGVVGQVDSMVGQVKGVVGQVKGVVGPLRGVVGQVRGVVGQVRFEAGVCQSTSEQGHLRAYRGFNSETNCKQGQNCNFVVIILNTTEFQATRIKFKFYYAGMLYEHNLLNQHVKKMFCKINVQSIIYFNHNKY